MDSTAHQRHLLDQLHDWPTLYTFKFIVAADRVAEIEAVLPAGTVIEHRVSSGGKYISVTGRATMESADAVLAVYELARRVEGVIGL